MEKRSLPKAGSKVWTISECKNIFKDHFELSKPRECEVTGKEEWFYDRLTVKTSEDVISPFDTFDTEEEAWAEYLKRAEKELKIKEKDREKCRQKFEHCKKEFEHCIIRRHIENQSRGLKKS